MSRSPVRKTSAKKNQSLKAFFRGEWEHTLREHPVLASRMGDRRYNDRWDDLSLDAYARREEHERRVLKHLSGLDPATLSDADRLNCRLFLRECRMDLGIYRHRLHLLTLNQLGGIQTASQLADEFPLETAADYRDWIARLRAFPGFMDQMIALMRAGIEAGVIHPKVVLERVADQIETQITEDPEQSPFYKPFGQIPREIGSKERGRLAADGKRAIRDAVVPAFRRFREFFGAEYLPAGYDKVGMWQFPRGRQAYAHLVRMFTTTDLTPDEVHRIGKREVRRIGAEMKKVMKRTGFRGGLKGFMRFLRTDPRFFYKTGEELLQAYRALAKRIDPAVVRLFRRLPWIPYGVEPVPKHLEPHMPAAFYRRPAADGSRAGSFFVNLYQVETRPKYEMAVLTLHEAVPGHHLQIAHSMELKGLPEFRRYGGYTAFIEGWGLYSESLGEELGLFDDPYWKFGQLTFEMWRAVRLVVDTGIHYHAWSRRKAIEYCVVNCARSPQDMVNEVDRYIAMPGQALAYKIGELKIQELRERGRRALGKRFDIRAFHDAILGQGAVTLEVLESQVKAWIRSAAKGASGRSKP
ncbi:MAG: DUF885 domain-containing protein [Elusimicrobiota bacterium]